MAARGKIKSRKLFFFHTKREFSLVHTHAHFRHKEKISFPLLAIELAVWLHFQESNAKEKHSLLLTLVLCRQHFLLQAGSAKLNVMCGFKSCSIKPRRYNLIIKQYRS